MKPLKHLGDPIFSLTLGIGLLTGPGALAATWNGGGGDGNWSTATNWSTGLVPSGAEAAVIGASAAIEHNSAQAFSTSGMLILGAGGGVISVLNVGPGSGTLEFGGDGYNSAARIGDNAGNGTLNISGGKVQIGTGLAGNDASINLAVFSGTGTTGMIHVSGGELQVGRRILIAANGGARVGTVTLSGSGRINMVATGTNGEGDLGMLRMGNGTATLNFDGGEFVGRGIRQDVATSASRVYYNGTQFTLNGNSGTGLSALIGSGGAALNQIKEGGLKIDTNGFSGTIAKGIGNFTGVSGVLTKSGLGTLQMASGGQTYSQTVVSGGVLNFSVNDAFGNHSGSTHSLVIHEGGLVTNATTATGFTTFRDLVLNGGELRATNTLSALSGTFQAYHLRDTVTVGGSTASIISDVGQANGAINIGGVADVGGGFGTNAVFSVADATASAAADLTVSAKLKDSAAPGTFALLRTGIDKTGVGTLALSGVNSYSGSTNIQQGTLALVDGGAIAASAVIHVSTGATFDVSATSSPWSLATGQSLVGGGMVAGDVAITGTLAPGSGIGTLSFGGGLELLGTSNFELDAAGSLADLVAVSGSLVFGGVLNVLNLGGVLADGQSFDLFDFDLSQSSGTFSELNLPSPGRGLTWDTSSLYQTGVIAVTIPEPSAAVFTGLAGLVFLRRRRN